MLSASLPLPLLQGSNQSSQYDVIPLTLPYTVQPSSGFTLAALLARIKSDGQHKKQSSNTHRNLCFVILTTSFFLKDKHAHMIGSAVGNTLQANRISQSGCSSFI